MDQETPTQRQARVRRERREAKIKEGGTSRLEKITQISGRQNLADTSLHQATTAPSLDESALPTLPTMKDHEPNTGNHEPIDAGSQPFPRASVPDPDGFLNQGQISEDDPVMRLFSQLMGEMPSNMEGDAAPSGQLPPSLATLMGKGSGAGTQASTQTEASIQDRIWKVLHACFAFTLAIYVIVSSPTLSAQPTAQGTRETGPSGGEGINLFWAFATAELLLQSTRYFLERGGTSSEIGGTLGVVSNFLPSPWAGCLRLIARYSGIWSTVMEDAYVLIFVIGMISWWRGSS